MSTQLQGKKDILSDDWYLDIEVNYQLMKILSSL